MVSANERINELQTVIRQLQGELADLQVGPCPRCNSDMFFKVENEKYTRQSIQEKVAQKFSPSLNMMGTKYATADYTWRCYECHYPSGPWLQQPEHNRGPFSRWLKSKGDALAVAGLNYPDAEKYEITFEPTFLAQPPPRQHELVEGVAMSCPAVNITDSMGVLKTVEQLQKDNPDLFPM